MDKASALEFYKDGRGEQENEVQQAVSSLEKSVKEDPGYVPAYVAYFDLVNTTNAYRPELVAKAKAALSKALQIDETNVGAHVAMGRLLMQFEL